MTRRWLIAATAILTVSGISLFTVPAMAREDHLRYVRMAHRGHSVVWRRSALLREVAICHPAQVRAIDARARHFQAPHHEAYRR